MFVSAAGAADFDRLPHLRLMRTPKVGSCTGICLSDRVTELWTHFHRGATVGCSGEGCRGCHDKCPMRYEGYLALWNSKKGNSIIIGFPVGATRQLVEQRGNTSGFRGVAVEFRRASKKANSRILVNMTGQWPDPKCLPAIPDLHKHLARIWGVEHAADVHGADRVQMMLRDIKEPSTDASSELWPDDRFSVAIDLDKDELDGQLHFPGTS